MPNITVPAAGGAMPAAKFDRTAIMQAARASYRDWHARQERIHGPCPFNRSEFAICGIWKINGLPIKSGYNHMLLK